MTEHVWTRQQQQGISVQNVLDNVVDVWRNVPLSD